MVDYSRSVCDSLTTVLRLLYYRYRSYSAVHMRGVIDFTIVPLEVQSIYSDFTLLPSNESKQVGQASPGRIGQL